MRALLIAIALLCVLPCALARDNGQWEATTPEIRQWYSELKQPDNPRVSCCGEADAYYADGIEIIGDKVFAIITDTRDDAPLGRPHVPPGTKVEIPNHKLKYDRGNPTGHNVIFLNGALDVLCFVQTSGA